MELGGDPVRVDRLSGAATHGRVARINRQQKDKPCVQWAETPHCNREDQQ